MSKIVYNTGNHLSTVYIGESWSIVSGMINPGKTIIITDDNVFKYYGNSFPDCRVIRVKPGEQSKSIETIKSILRELVSSGMDRTGFLLGIGGGVICDITGFAASIFMRGIKFGFVSTSLLSQVDASIGGKNGVNLDGVKNIIGCFTQPEFVICDQLMLKTLPDDEFRSGLGELVKHGAIRDKELFNLIAGQRDLILSKDLSFLNMVIERSVRIKKEIVEKDEKEKGERRILNFGHTIGHAIEASAGLKHGLAIAHGMVVAAKYSVAEGKLDEAAYKRLHSVLTELQLLGEVSFDMDSLFNSIGKDKKREGNKLNFVGLKEIGNAYVTAVSIEKFLANLKKILLT